MHKHPHAAAILGFLLLARLGAFGAAGDEHWDYQFGWPGTGGSAGAIVTHNGLLYASGTGTTTTNVAVQVWDGEQWSVLAQIYGAPGAQVYNMAFLGDTLFAVGAFTNVNGLAITNFARWDGTNWNGMNFNGLVTTLVVNGTNLYVGGAFTNAAAGGTVATNIAYWDGSVWHALGSGVGTYSGLSFGVNAIAFQSGRVYAGGLFTNCGPYAISNLAVWNGSAWAAVGGGVNNNVFGLTFNNGNLYAAGLFTQAGSTPAGLVAQWDGANWTALGGGLTGGGATRFAVFNGLLYVGGTFTVAGGGATNLAAWNGTSWSAAGSGVSGPVGRLLADGGNLYVGGNFLLAGGTLANGIAAWDGASWHSLGTPGRINGISGPVDAINGDGTNVLIGGTSFAAAGRTSATRIAWFDGTNWFPIGSGLNSNVLAVASIGGQFYAAGLFTGDGAGYGPLAYHMAHWDGTHWSELNNTPFVSPTELGSYGGSLLVAGYFGIPGADGTDWWLTRWDGANFWSVLAYPPAATFVSMNFDNIGFSALAVQGNDIYVSGQLSISECDSSFNNCTNSVFALHFDGTYAWPMGTGLNTNATAIAVAGSHVYFAGPNLTNAGGVAISQIAQWDGSAWSNVGGGVVGRGSINALAAIGNNLYVGGSFTNVGGVPATRIAKWDGTSWAPLGSGVSSTVQALFAQGNDLWVGGNLRTAGGKPSNYLARWNDHINFDVPQIAPLFMTNGQFRLRLLGFSGETNIVVASTNLTTWTPILTNTAGIYDFTDPDSASYRARFYRAVLGPLTY